MDFIFYTLENILRVTQKNALLTLIWDCSKILHFEFVAITAACNYNFGIVGIFRFKGARHNFPIINVA